MPGFCVSVRSGLCFEWPKVPYHGMRKQFRVLSVPLRSAVSLSGVLLG